MHKIENKLSNYEFIREINIGSVIFDTENYDIEVFTDKILVDESYWSDSYKGNHIMIYNNKLYIDKVCVTAELNNITINQKDLHEYEIIFESSKKDMYISYVAIDIIRKEV